MATSDVSICNLALQILGASRITSLTEDSRNARACNACYEAMRDAELRVYPWRFAITRAVLTPSATAPLFDYTYAFPLPADCLRVLLPNRARLDWKRETQGGVQVILTNDGTSINLRYLKRVTDPAQFDPAFVKMVASSMADFMCEQITQSNEKKKDADAKYEKARAEARRNDAFETISDTAPEDSWVSAQRTSSSDTNWLRFGGV